MGLEHLVKTLQFVYRGCAFLRYYALQRDGLDEVVVLEGVTTNGCHLLNSRKGIEKPVDQAVLLQ